MKGTASVKPALLTWIAHKCEKKERARSRANLKSSNCGGVSARLLQPIMVVDGEPVALAS
jgi:hypothetical protein